MCGPPRAWKNRRIERDRNHSEVYAGFDAQVLFEHSRLSFSLSLASLHHVKKVSSGLLLVLRGTQP